MDELFFTGRIYHKSEKDVSITVRKERDGLADIGIVFRNKVHEKIAPHTGYFGFAIKGSRIYFCEFNEGEGFKFSANKGRKGDNRTDNGRRYTHFQGAQYAELREFAIQHGGSYDLSWDEKYQHWCVETNLLFKGKNGKVL